MRAASVPFLLALLACGPAASPAPDGGLPPDAGSADAGPGDAGTPDAGFADAGASDGGALQGDLAVFEAMRAGTLDLHDGFLAVAHGDGWPIETEGGFVFARRDEGRGPYRLAGDHNAWVPEAMIQTGALYWTVLDLPAPEGLRYKFVDAQDTFAADPWARNYGSDGYGEFSLVRPDGPHLERWPELTDGVLLPRALQIWVPADPPVRHLYAHDGQNLFDYGAPYGGWRVQDVSGPATLVVGLDNTAQRMNDYTHVEDSYNGTTYPPLADRYAAFILEQVRPFVEARYGLPTRRGVMGSSLGGLVSLYMAQRDPGEWDYALSLSGTLGWGSRGETNPTLLHTWPGHLATRLYLDSGGGPGSGCVDTDGDGVEDDAQGAADNYCENRQMVDHLADDLGYQWDVELWHWWEPDAPHNEGAWRARVHRPLAIFEAP